MRRALFDFGGVVIRTPFELLDAVGNPPWSGPFDPDADRLWRLSQDGEITERDYWQRRASELFGGNDPVRRLMDCLYNRPEVEVVRPEVVELVAELDRPAALTNDLARFHSADWIERITVIRRFDPLIDLSNEPVLKPDPAAFETALTRLGEDPSGVVFVDDQPRNVEGAARAGLPVVWFDVTDPAGSVRRIRRALG